MDYARDVRNGIGTTAGIDDAYACSVDLGIQVDVWPDFNDGSPLWRTTNPTSAATCVAIDNNAASAADTGGDAQGVENVTLDLSGRMPWLGQQSYAGVKVQQHYPCGLYQIIGSGTLTTREGTISVSEFVLENRSSTWDLTFTAWGVGFMEKFRGTRGTEAYRKVDHPGDRPDRWVFRAPTGKVTQPCPGAWRATGYFAFSGRDGTNDGTLPPPL